MPTFTDTVWDEWIRKDPINNDVPNWITEYCIEDRGHANEKGMELIVDFVLKQPNILKVLE